MIELLHAMGQIRRLILAIFCITCIVVSEVTACGQAFQVLEARIAALEKLVTAQTDALEKQNTRIAYLEAQNARLADRGAQVALKADLESQNARLAGLEAQIVRTVDLEEQIARLANLEDQIARKADLAAQSTGRAEENAGLRLGVQASRLGDQGNNSINRTKTSGDLDSATKYHHRKDGIPFVAKMKHDIDESMTKSTFHKQTPKDIQDQLVIEDLKQEQFNSPRSLARRLPVASEVAFQASFAQNHATTTLNKDSFIVFDTVTLNLGGGYHPSHGLFIAPRTGVYLFSVSVTAVSIDERLHADIEKNGVEVAGCVAYDKNGVHHQCSVSVVISLSVGDEVFVKIERWDHVTIYGDRLTSFTGILLYD